ncbi:hypothetical protein DY000_02012821 [Brassica cretica]|uniref:Uncharacterized protein n=1 Tax=Brassica cretica TaxID=69181 RepID=A0ABQ7CQP6_BRACR|nr:hypothetical protein DY000_02012821 [Brassica cretica]
MAKNLSSVTFTILLLVLLMASTEILKIEAMNINARCLPKGCKNATFSEECGPEPFRGSNNDCCHCCVAKYGRKAVCKGVVEDQTNTVIATKNVFETITYNHQV